MLCPKKNLGSYSFRCLAVRHFWAFVQIGQLRNNPSPPPAPPPRGKHLPTRTRLGRWKSGLRRNPMEGRCAKTQYGKVGALQYWS